MMNAFHLLGEDMVSVIEDMGIAEPTEIQEAAIPIVLSGINALIVSSTGTGKTEAALLPIFYNMMKSSKRNAITAIYVTPLRALNRDIFRRMVEIGEDLGVEVRIRHGDTSQAERRRQVKHPPDVLITTPETLGIVLNVKSLLPHLKNVRYIVVDEYHELMESKRGVQFSLVLERLKSHIDAKIQIIGLSATIGDPETAMNALMGKDVDGCVVEAALERGYDVTITHFPRREASTEVEEALIENIRKVGKSLVFTNTRGQAEALSLKLKTKDPSLRVGVHHGSLAASIREGVEKAFNEDELDAVVCTSSMELGVDISGVKNVAQWNSPRRITKLAQRIGRSEHRPRTPAKGVVFARTVDDLFESLAIVDLLRKNMLEEPVLYSNSLDVLAHQIVGVALNRRGISLEEVYNLFRGSFFYSQLSMEKLEEIVDFLSELRILYVRNDGLYPRKGSIAYYFENASTIPDIASYEMRDAVERRKIATLDESFVGEHCDKSSKILVNGETWRVVRVDEDRMRVHVAKDSFDIAVIPQWVGEMLLVDNVVAERAGGLQRLWTENSEAIEEWIDMIVVDRERLGDIKREVTEFLENREALPGIGNITASLVKGKRVNLLVLNAYLGDRLNETLAQLMKAMVKSTMGLDLRHASSPYRTVFLDHTKSIDPDSFAENFKRISGFIDGVGEILRAEVTSHGKFLWIFWNVCKRMGAVRRGTNYRKKLAQDLYWHLREKPPVEEAVNELFTRYYDVEGAKRLLREVANGRLEVRTEVVTSWTSRNIEYFLGGETVAYKEFVEEREALDLLRRRVMDSRVNLLCLNCGATMGPYSVSYLTKEKLRCPTCNSRLLGKFFPDEEGYRMAKKIGKRKKLSEKEKVDFERIRTTARLISNFGLRALWCLQAYGVGPEASKRILRHPSRDEEDFFRRVLEEQRKYFETRMYWD